MVIAINDDPCQSYSADGVSLFGCVLTAGPGETIGDLDVAVELRRRPEDDAVLMVEIRSAQSSHRGVQVRTWPGDRVKWRLRRVDRMISPQPVEVALLYDHRENYRREAKWEAMSANPALHPGLSGSVGGVGGGEETGRTQYNC